MYAERRLRLYQRFFIGIVGRNQVLQMSYFITCNTFISIMFTTFGLTFFEPLPCFQLTCLPGRNADINQVKVVWRTRPATAHETQPISIFRGSSCFPFRATPSLSQSSLTEIIHASQDSVHNVKISPLSVPLHSSKLYNRKAVRAWKEGQAKLRPCEQRQVPRLG